MLKYIFLFPLLMMMACNNPTGNDHYALEVTQWRKEKDASFKTDENSPLDSVAKSVFKGLLYFPVNEAYRLEATFMPELQPAVFDMPHTLGQAFAYKKAGILTFTINHQTYSLTAYVNANMNSTRELFIPFTDLTNGNETYDSGRYLDITWDGKSTKVIADFNFAYQPFCLYNKDYSCPIPPRENQLNTRIEAGEKMVNK